MIRSVLDTNLMVSLFAVVSFSFMGCSGEAVIPPTQTCSAQTCPNGCCQGNYCSQGTAQSACGVGGQTCSVCTTTQDCTAGQCVTASSTCNSTNCSGCCTGNTCDSYGVSNNSCGQNAQTCDNCTAKGGVCDASSRTCVSGAQPDCDNKCKGASNGIGGTCETNGCTGCCDGVQCLPGTLDAACGGSGGECANCTGQGTTCNTSTNTCASCTPNCAGKCAGASDGCGSACPTNQCNGCCNGSSCEVGTAHAVCGASGNACANCTASGSTCSSGTCVGGTCTPNCNSKCAGASDGCGSTCPTTDCNSGCCSGSTCLPGTSNTACGSIGLGTAKADGSCWPCSASYPSCDAATHTCKASTTPSECSGEPDGTSCSSGNGECRNQSCCTGCWDGSTCLPGATDEMNCGSDGELCTSCTGTNVCNSGVCGPASTTCPGGDLSACTGGVCVGGSCCKGCWYTGSGGALKCQSSLDDNNCGLAGASCDTCKSFEDCDATSGACELSADATWRIKVVKATLLDERPNYYWDDWVTNANLPPDPTVEIEKGPCGTGAFGYSTPVDNNTYTPTWNYLLPPAGTLQQYHFTVAIFSAGICVKVYDADSTSLFDLMGECTLTISESDLLSGKYTVTDCGYHPNYDIHIVKTVELEFEGTSN